MSRAVFAALTIVLLRDCEVVGVRPRDKPVTGTWGGENAGLIADDTSAHVHIACTFGNVHQAIVLDAGRFDVPGDYVLRAYPVYVGPTDRKSTRLNSSHGYISYAVFCLKKKN